LSSGSGYLLDTNVISETRKSRADERVMAFLDATDSASLFLSVLTIGEMRKGIQIKRTEDADAAFRIGKWLDGIELTFADRLLPVDAEVAKRWGTFSADRSRPVIDTLIAATASVHELTLLTRNASDFVGLGISLVDPWRG
jgi:predicted nucleic acid-binding protein